MPKRVTVDVELPDELARKLSAEDLRLKVKEALVMELLREHAISQGKAAEILCIPREDLFPLMAKFQVSVVDLSSVELRAELEKPFPDRT